VAEVVQPSDSPMRVVVLHHVNGATKIADFHSSRVSSQLVTEGGVQVLLQDPEGHELGFAQFSPAGIVVLGGMAIDQYQPLRKAAGVTPGGPDA
jgi:hypothetical protein